MKSQEPLEQESKDKQPFTWSKGCFSQDQDRNWKPQSTLRINEMYLEENGSFSCTKTQTSPMDVEASHTKRSSNGALLFFSL